ncbi:MAG: hypothetical protein ACLGI3_08060 [Actinomycetes bacterium]
MSAPALESAPPGKVHHLLPAALVAGAVALLVVLPELLGALGRLAAVLVLQLGLVVAWVLTTGIQGFTGSLALGAAAAVAADLALVLPPRGTVGGLLLVLGLGFLAAVLQQMSRRPRHDLVASLSGGALLLCAISALAALLLAGRAPAGQGPAVVSVLAVGSALVAGHLVDSVLPRPELAPGVPRGLLGLGASVAAGALVALAGAGLGGAPGVAGALASGALLGLVAGLAAVAASYVVVDVTADGVAAGGPWAPAVLQAVVPLAACAPVVLALDTALHTAL